MDKFIITDWAGNLLFKDKDFETFEEAWDFIYENVDNSKYDETENEDDNEYQEYYVVTKSEYFNK